MKNKLLKFPASKLFILSITETAFRIRFKFLIALCFLLALSGMISQGQVFTNNVPSGCNTWDSQNTYAAPGLQKQIVVSGLATPLGTGMGQVVLNQVNLELGSSTCTGNLSSYYVRLVSPAGTIIQLVGPFCTTSTSQWLKIKLRDHSSLEPVKSYSSGVQQNYWPWSIGYYRTNVANAYSALNGENPNGTWTLQIAEATTSEVSFTKVELVFGPPIPVTDITNSTVNDYCSGSQCIEANGVYIGTNNSYSPNDPVYPADANGYVGACSWNGANNNSAWFSFVANATTAYISLSGITNNPPGGSDTQPIVVTRNGGCGGTGSWTVPTGGCPDDVPLNNGAYVTANGGGSSASNVYFNGISANCEFNLSGLTIGNTYYLLIDGNGGIPSTFYIAMQSGGLPCTSPLGVEFFNFKAEKYEDDKAILKWSTLNEFNCNYFEVQRSNNGTHFNKIGTIKGAGNSSHTINYSFIDPTPLQSINFYRLKQVDTDENFGFSNIVSLKATNTDNIVAYYDSESDNIFITNLMSKGQKKIRIFDCTGKLLTTQTLSDNSVAFDMIDFAHGVYFVSIEESNSIAKFKICK